jgi:hypothetical protein
MLGRCGSSSLQRQPGSGPVSCISPSELSIVRDLPNFLTISLHTVPAPVHARQAGQAQRVKNIFRFFALLFIPFGAYVPAGVALLWVSNSMFSVLAGVLMRQDAFRAAVGLPTLEHLRNISSQLQSMATKDPTSFVPSAAASGAGGSAASAAYPGAGAGSAQGASVWPQATTGSSSSSSSSSALNSGGIQVPPPPGTPAQVAQEAQVGGQPPQPSEADMQMLQELIAQLQQQQEEGTQPKPES